MLLFNKILRGDSFIWMAVIFLSLLGILAVYSSTGSLAFVKQGGNTEYFFFKHTGFVVFGLILMYICHIINYRFFFKIASPLLLLSVILLVLTLIIGDDINNASRHITILGISFQTSDLAKVSLILYIAKYLSKNQEEVKTLRSFWRILFVIILICALIAPENLSTALVLFTTSCALLFIGRINLKHLGILGGSTLLFGIIFYFTITNLPESEWLSTTRIPTWKSRIEKFMAGDEEATYQTQQARIAVATGGLFGKGPGKSTQSNYLPHPYSDFIFAIIIEEYGLLLGGMSVIIAFLLILYRAIRIVIKSPKAFGALVAAGLSFSLVFHAFIHMGVAVTLLPVTGLTLPLVSMGGTSMIFTSFAFGMILSVSRSIEDNEQGNEQHAATA